MKKFYFLFLLLILPRLMHAQNPCPGLPTISYAGKTYSTVKIGSQCWLKNNLDVGTRINGIQEQTNNSVIEKYCYGDDTLNCTTYGGLYQWAEAVQYQNGAANNVTLPSAFSGNVQGICPSGWHIPTNAEITTLSTSVANHSDAFLSLGQSSGTNTSGFSAVLSGQRDAAGTFSALGSHASFLTTTEVNSSSAYNLFLTSGSDVQFAWRDSKPAGFNIRCLIDSLPKVSLLSPSSGTVDIPFQTTLNWNPFLDATSYTLQIATDSIFSHIIFNDSTITSTSKQVTGLGKSTIYYWHIKAKSGYGTSLWSNFWTFMTIHEYCPGAPTIIIEGRSYNTVVMNNECWLKENLNIGIIIKAKNNQQSDSTTEKYCYNDDTLQCLTYGGLYQWAEAVKYNNTPGSNGVVQGICPMGWHLPPFEHFVKLIDTYQSVGLKAYGSGIGDAIGTNVSGFSAITAPYRDASGNFTTITSGSNFWGAEDSDLGAYHVYLPYSSTTAVRNNSGNKLNGFSIRCIRDSFPTPQLFFPGKDTVEISMSPTLRWRQFPGTITYTLQVSKDSLFNNFIYNSTLSDTSKQLTGLLANTSYFWRLNTINIFNTTRMSPTWKFTTASTSCKDFATITYAGKLYHTVQVGNQCWLKENLDVGTRVNGSLTQGNNSIIEKYCYNDDTLNCKTYGGLYQWTEAMQYITSPGAQGICPTGWRIPSKEDYDTLTTTVKSNANVLLAIGQAKGNNTTGFSALFAGKRNDAGVFTDLTKNSTFWTSTPYFYYMDLNYIDSTMYSNTYAKEYGLSVRCIYGDVLTDIKDKAVVPSEYNLKQNYPNPFNPTTKIEYSLPAAGQVKLQVFTVEGELIKTLVSEHQEAGNYSVDFSGKNLSTGMYIYKLSLNDRNIFKKMLFLK